MDHVTVDVEIQKTIEETPGGWDATDQLGVSVACLWEAKTQRMRIYGSNDLDSLRQRLLQADRISGFNIFNFDFPVIWCKSKGEWRDAGLPTSTSSNLSTTGELKQKLLPKTDDILRRIWQALGLDPDRFRPHTHGGTKLDIVTQHTLGIGKIGYGGDVPKWYQAGQLHRVINYCADDVALERDLCEFIDKYGYVNLGSKGIVKIPQWKMGT